MKTLISLLKRTGFILFGISIILSSCKSFEPVPTMGSSLITDNLGDTMEINDLVCGQTIEYTQDDLIWQFEGKSYNFSSSECLDLFKTAPENWGATAEAMMLVMLL